MDSKTHSAIRIGESKRLSRDKKKRAIYAAGWYRANREKAVASGTKWRRANPEKVAAAWARWKAANPEKAAAGVARWRAANPEKVVAGTARYRAANPEKVAARVAMWAKANPRRSDRWRAANPGKVNSYSAARRSAKLHATPAWADRKHIEDFYTIADILGKITGIPHSVDHIIPLQGENVCGFHVEGNLQVIAASQNSRKGNSYSGSDHDRV